MEKTKTDADKVGTLFGTAKCVTTSKVAGQKQVKIYEKSCEIYTGEIISVLSQINESESYQCFYRNLIGS
jgi:hypothetical protein